MRKTSARSGSPKVNTRNQHSGKIVSVNRMNDESQATKTEPVKPAKQQKQNDPETTDPVPSILKTARVQDPEIGNEAQLSSSFAPADSVANKQAQQSPAIRKADSSMIQQTVDSAKLKEAVAAVVEKARKKNPVIWTAGLGFQQPIAIGSQQTNHYNFNGRKSWIEDHIPGAYVTAGKKQWFASAYFNYAVPQPVEPLSFTQTTKYSPSNSTIDVERYSVEKIYYHHFGLNGNYFLLPSLSVGAGASYLLLAGAVTEREIQTRNLITGNEQTVRDLAPVKGYKDSFLFNSTALAMLEADYHFKRIKLGIRYGHALQPFLRYTKPDGNIQDVKNNSLQMILRFQLWKSE